MACYEINKQVRAHEAEALLRALFPDGAGDEMNLCFFSTSGIHGTYSTIEGAAASLASDEPEDTNVTFLVLQPRTVRVWYGNVEVTADNVEWLKWLRDTSLIAAGRVGVRRPDETQA